MKKLTKVIPLKPVEWANEAVLKHGWKDAHRIALQCQKTPSHYWAKVSTWIKTNAPAGALEEQ
jgi:hypothetical protein